MIGKTTVSLRCCNSFFQVIAYLISDEWRLLNDQWEAKGDDCSS